MYKMTDIEIGESSVGDFCGGWVKVLGIVVFKFENVKLDNDFPVEIP